MEQSGEDPSSSSHAPAACPSCSHAPGTTTPAPCAPAPEPPTPRLLQLPSELLLLLWRKLSDIDDENLYHDQLALRSTCRQARQATAPFIRCLEIEVQQFDSEEDDETTCEEILEESMSKVAGFPSDAVMTSLHWECWKEDRSCLVLPALLPTFLINAGGKLAALEELVLSGVVAMGCGELSSVAMSCPNMRRLALTSVPVVGPALWPLARLPGLHTLTLKNVKLPCGRAGVGPSLSSLHQLSELRLLDYEGEPATHDALRLEDVLPYITELRGLRKLKLALGRRDSDDLHVFCKLSKLSQLTSLYCQISVDQSWSHSILELNRPHGLHPECHLLCSLHVYPVALSTQLVRLSLPGAILDSGAIRLLMFCRQLTELEVDALLPDEDLTELNCGWRRLKLGGCQPPGKLLLLPMAGVREVTTRGVECLRWELDAEADVAATAATLLAVSALLAPVWTGNEAGSRYLHLQWTAAPAAPSAGAGVLAALAPWDPSSGGGGGAAAAASGAATTTLFLGKHWDVSDADVRALNTHLPHLRALAVSALGPSFTRFTVAAAAEMPQLVRLSVVDAAELPGAARDALLALATLRAARGLPLTIYAYGCLSSSQRIGCNAIAQAHAKGIDASQVRFEVW